METANATAQSAADASSSPAIASQYPPPREGDWEARNFQFAAGEVFDRTLDRHIANLRAKIEVDPQHPRYVLTVYGSGYKLAELP